MIPYFLVCPLIYLNIFIFTRHGFNTCWHNVNQNKIHNLHTMYSVAMSIKIPSFFLLISLIKGQQKCSYRQNNYCCSCSEDGLSMSCWKIMNWLQSKGKGHCPSKSCSRPQSAKFRHQNKENNIGKKQFLSLAELIKLHMVKSMNCVDWFLTTIPKCLLVFWRYLSMSRSDQIDQVSTREDIRGSAWNHPRILLSTFKWNVKAKHKLSSLTLVSSISKKEVVFGGPNYKQSWTTLTFFFEVLSPYLILIFLKYPLIKQIFKQN